MIDLSKIKPGDEVTVRVSVVKVGTDLKVAVAGIADGVWFAADEVVSHTPKALSVGDRVKVEGFVPGTVIGIDGDAVWLKSENGRWWINVYPLTKWERA